MSTVKSTFVQIIKRKETLLFLILFISGLSLLGWMMDKIILTSVSLKYIPIAPSTALIFVVLSILSLITNKFENQYISKSVGIIILLLVVLFCVDIILNYFFNFKWDIENILIKIPSTLGNVPIGRMSPITALLFIFICIGIISNRRKNSQIVKYIGGSFSLLLILISSILSIGYLYKAPLLYGSTIIPVALPTTICFLLFSITLLRSYELKFWTFNLIKDNKITIQLLKSLLPIVLIIIVLQGFLNIVWFSKNINPAFSAALIAMILVGIIILVVSGMSSNIGTQLMKVEKELQESENILKERIKELNGTYSLGLLAEKFQEQEDIYNDFVNIIAPKSMQFSEKVFVSLEVEGKRYCNIEDFDLLPTWKYLSAPINILGKPQGELIVAYTEDLPFIDYYEQKLIESYAERISKISERMKTRRILEESESNYRTIADYNYDWEYWLTNDKKFKYISPSCEKISGYAPNDFFKNPDLFTQIIHHEDLPIYEKHLELVGKGEKCLGIDYRIITHSGDSCWINHVCQTVFDRDGNNMGRRGRNSDITIKKNAEIQIKELNRKLIELNADKDRFISILGHDLKNPFNNILGFSEILTDEIGSLNKEEIKDIAKNINKSANLTNNLLEDILMWARSQQGKITFEKQQLNFADICRNIVEVLKPNAFAKGITISCTDENPINVFADKDMLKAVILNLVSNAIKFTTNGGEIIINAKQTESDVLISVSDNGIGIEKEDLSKLFDLSEVLTTKGTAGETGTGLGLLLCKEFVEKHQGKIWVESEVGKGSDFKFTLPSNAEPNEVNVVENVISDGEVDSKISNLKVLITDDNEASRKLLGISVKQFAKEISYATNGFEAVVAGKDNPDIDVILMDIKMPEMDGFEATRQIRQFNKEVVIIVQTAFSDSGEKEKAEEAGCSDFITKPINKTLLQELIKTHFNK